MTTMKINFKNIFHQLCAVIAAFCISFSASAVDIYVDQNASGANDGSSWMDAFKFLHEGLEAANPNDTVLVAKGTYYPDECKLCGPSGTNDQTDSFNVPLQVVVEGGYAGETNNPSDPFERDFILYETILSGDIHQDDTNSPAENPGHIVGNNSFHVVTIIDDSAGQPFIFGTEVDGFTITAGNALHSGMGDNDTGGGGGAFIVDESLPEIFTDPFREGPLFRNCIFQGNRADRTGGAIAALEVGLEVRDCQILNNESDGGIISI